MGAGSSFFGAEDRRWNGFFEDGSSSKMGLIRSSGSEERKPPIFDLRSEDWVEDRHRPRGVIVLPMSCLRLRRTKNPSHLRSPDSKNEEPLIFVLRFRRTKNPSIFAPSYLDRDRSGFWIRHVSASYLREPRTSPKVIPLSSI